MPTLMFPEVTCTWNPFVGCVHDCTYCSARRLAETRLKNLPQYKDFSHPVFVKRTWRHKFNKGLIFCCNMGDLWAAMTPEEYIRWVLARVFNSPRATFLMLTKNAGRYLEFMDIMPPNVILGVTMETDRYPKPGISRAPSPMNRFLCMSTLKKRYPEARTMVSIEPIIDFDFFNFLPMITACRPEVVYIGYDNHNCRLPEPTLEKTQKLIEALRGFTEVRLKTLREAWNAPAGS